MRLFSKNENPEGHVRTYKSDILIITQIAKMRKIKVADVISMMLQIFIHHNPEHKPEELLLISEQK